MADVVARDLVIHGHVQGVFFRAFVEDAATRAGVSGRAVNRDDGSVAIRLEGDPAAVAQVERAAGQGPGGARVASVDARDAEPEGLTGFGVA